MIALPCDMPFVTAAELTALATTDADVATLAPGQPFPVMYRRALLPQLREAIQAGASMRSTQAQSTLAPAAIASMDQASQFAVNTPKDLARAERLLNPR